MPHCLLRSIISIINVFHKHAKSDGHCQRLTKKELMTLFQQEFGNALEVRRIVTLLAHVLWYLGLSSWLQWYYSLLLSSYLSSYFFSRLFQVPPSMLCHLRADVLWDSILTLCVPPGNSSNSLCFNHSCILHLSVNSPVRVSLLSFRHVKYPMDIA